MADTTQQGIEALKSGNRAAARQLLAAAVKENPKNILAWLWLSGAVDKDEERASCLKQVLRIDPSNAAALKGLSQIQEKRIQQQPSATAVEKAPPPGAAVAAAADQQPPAPDVENNLPGAAPARDVAAKEVETQESATPEAPLREAAAAEAERPASSAPDADPPANPNNENHSPWATAQSAADSVASAVYGLRAELASQTDEADLTGETTAPDMVMEERLSAIDQPTAEEAPAPASAVEAVADTPPAAPVEAAAPGEDTAEQEYAETAVAPQSQRSTAAVPPAYYGAEPAGRLIFRTRPSVVPALIAFWVFFFGSVAAANILSQADMMAGLVFGLVIGFALELVIVYIAIRNMRIRYELTNRQLSLPHQGKQVQILIPDIFHAECQQTFLQRLVGLGDIRLDAIVGGELARLRMRDVPQCDVRAQQIMYLVKDLT